MQMLREVLKSRAPESTESVLKEPI
jgi:hypothetical protein